jgi:hypothetical protein
MLELQRIKGEAAADYTGKLDLDPERVKGVYALLGKISPAVDVAKEFGFQ